MDSTLGRRSHSGRRDQIIERIEVDHARCQFDMRVFLLIRGTGCAAVGWVLLTILMK